MQTHKYFSALTIWFQLLFLSATGIELKIVVPYGASTAADIAVKALGTEAVNVIYNSFDVPSTFFVVKPFVVSGLKVYPERDPILLS